MLLRLYGFRVFMNFGPAMVAKYKYSRQIAIVGNGELIRNQFLTLGSENFQIYLQRGS